MLMHEPGYLPYSVALLFGGKQRTRTSSATKNLFILLEVTHVSLFLILFYLYLRMLYQMRIIECCCYTSKFDQKIDQTNSFIEIITEDDIKRSSASTITDLLKTNSSLGYQLVDQVQYLLIFLGVLLKNISK